MIRRVTSVAVFCDQCQTIGPAAATAKDARWLAEGEGWSVKRGGPDRCGMCTETTGRGSS